MSIVFPFSIAATFLICAFLQRRTSQALERAKRAKEAHFALKSSGVCLTLGIISAFFSLAIKAGAALRH